MILLIASTILIFLAAIASSNAVASSPMEQIALLVHRVSMFLMLIAFIGILAAYRIPFMLAALENRAERRHAEGSKWRLAAEMKFLLIASGLLVVWVWAVVWLGYPVLLQLTYWLLLILAGLLVNMAILHQGCLRSFAVGTLVTMLLALFTWRSLLAVVLLGQQGRPFGGRPDFSMLYGSFSMEVTLSVVSGLICAFYYNLVIQVRSRAEPPPAKPA